MVSSSTVMSRIVHPHRPRDPLVPLPDPVLNDPSSLGAIMRPRQLQPCMVEATHKANWPARKRLTEVEQAAVERVAI
jgi:hypothetical protein